MKITNYIIIFVIIMLPFQYINNHKTNAARLTLEKQLLYDAAVDTAVRDAAMALDFNVNQNYEVQYQSRKNIRVNPNEAMKAFWNTLFLNFESKDDPVMQGVLMRYVPIVVIIGYDGFYSYVMERYRNEANETEIKHLFQPKKPYAYSDQHGNSISFTLDDFVSVYERNTDTWHFGRRAEIAPQCPTVPLLQDANLFDQIRRSTIVNSIQSDLEYFINYYNEHATRYGISYTFTLPRIPDEAWNNSIDDVGVLAFFQGLPLGHTTYNHYAFGGARLVKKTEIKGVTRNSDGVRYYFKNECSSYFTSADYTVQETFASEKEAAEAGYYPLSCSNPSLITHQHTP